MDGLAVDAPVAPRPRTPEPARKRAQALSLAIAVMGYGAIVALGLKRYSLDGSFWIDEASVANSIRYLGFAELFGPLRFEISFPRWYLLVYKLLNETVGFQTAVLRFPSLVCFLVGTVLWVRIFYVRFRVVPWLLALGILLNFFPTTWFVYSSMLKQYTFDVMLVLALFSISDETLEKSIRGGERPWLMVLVTLPCALSYTYVFGLAGRCAGWYLTEVARGRYALDARALATFCAGLVLFNVSLYFTDVRHTLAVESLASYWRTCTLTSDAVAPSALLDETLFGWYTGRTLYSGTAALDPRLVALLRIFMLIGALRVVFLLATERRRGDPERRPWSREWGTRSTGAFFCVVALLAGGVVIDYPLCATRLILFSLFCMQLLVLEGVDAVRSLIGRAPRGDVAAGIATLALVAAITPDAVREYRHHLDSRPPQNLRPLLARIHARETRPIMVDACTIRQIKMLPEGHGEGELIYYLRRWGFSLVGDLIPYDEEAWVINTQIPCPPFGDPFKGLKKAAVEWKDLTLPRDTATLYWVKFGKEPAPASGTSRPAKERDRSP